jgi:hypothetical protein
MKFLVVKKRTRGKIGYLKLSHFILIQNGGGSKLCLLCCSVGHVREHVARPCVCVMGGVCVWWVVCVCVVGGCGVCVVDVCGGCVCGGPVQRTGQPPVETTPIWS